MGQNIMNEISHLFLFDSDRNVMRSHIFQSFILDQEISLLFPMINYNM